MHFPSLTSDNHHVASQATDEYNCLAWAAEDTTRWWSPEPDYYWPPNISRDSSDIRCFIEAYVTLGYDVCDDGSVEPDFQKIALYLHPDGTPTHAARQLTSGKWTSKLGQLEDVEHDSEHDVEGDCQRCYGVVHTYMRRPRAT